jgi:DNA helicase-2/ATP-dependent DNA helicase PcrA
MARDYALHPFRPAIALQIDYPHELNAQQLAAVTAPPGPALVIAGAGAGKTRTLIYRVAYLLEQGVPADSILLLTFTNKAAREMMRRVADLLGNDLTALWGGTFHAVGHRLLRQHADLLGYPRDFTIIDREDQKDLLQACLADAQIDVKTTRFPKAEVLAEIFSLAANKQLELHEVLESQFDYFLGLADPIADLQRRYAERKRTTGVTDFDDLLALWLRLLRDHANVRELYQRRFQFVLVDEYQDTNRLQGDLIDLLAARHRNVMAVGDDAQSIYSWRGADFQNILQFTRRYPEATLYKIETNYRSTPEILALANAAIAANAHQVPKVLTPSRPSGPRPGLIRCDDAHAQAAFVAQRALELRDEGIPLNQMAVLYRAHFHALELQLELTRRNIPFSITSGIRFFEQAHIKDVAAHLRLLCNPRDELAFKRVVRLLPGVGGKSADRLWIEFDAARAAQPPDVPDAAPAAAACHPPAPGAVPDPSNPVSSLGAALQRCAASVPKKAATAWAQFATTMAQLQTDKACQRPARQIELVLDAGYEDYLKAQYPDARGRLDDLEQLTNFAQQFPSTDEFLAQLALLTNLETDETRPARDDSEVIRLSTVHQAKGLEFGVVFVIMLCEGLFPSARSLEFLDGLEEERRLFYVATTRAKNELYLCYPAIRYSHASEGLQMQVPSQFLRDLPEPVYEPWNLTG